MDNFFFDRPESQLLRKLRNANPDFYFQLAKTHLSYFMDDVPPGSLTVNPFVVESASRNRKPKRVRIGSSSKSPTTGVIGAPLTQEGICRVYQLIEFIGREENICKKNLFRRPGNAGRQENLKFKMNSGVPLDMDAEQITVYDCCEVLKRFLAELKEPLLPTDVYNVFRQIPDMVNKASVRTRQSGLHFRQLSAARILLLFVPTESFLLLYNIMTLMTSIIQHKEDNMTSSESLAILFTPSVLLPRKLNGSQMTQELPLAMQVMTFMIENMPSLFDPPPGFLQDVRAQLRNMEQGTPAKDLSVPVRVFHCRPSKISSGTEDYTDVQLKKLQADMDAIPNCSQKKLFHKKLKEQKNELIPSKPDINGATQSSGLASSFTEPIRKYLSKSFKRRNLFPNSGSSDKLSLSMSEMKSASPTLIMTRKKSSRY